MNFESDLKFSDLTTLKIGGPIKFFVAVESIDELKIAINFAKTKKIPYLVIGGGSNLLVSDQGYDGLVIKMQLTGIKKGPHLLKVGAGTLLQDLVDYTIDNNLDGMSTMTGIPGTVGGAVYGSAGAYGDNIRDYLDGVSYLNGIGQIVRLDRQSYTTGYRDSIFKRHRDWVILEIDFANLPTAQTDLKKEAAEILQKRAQKYPAQTLCPGSFFKNCLADKLSPETLAQIPADKIIYGKIPAGFLLEAVGAKGDQLGQIKIAQNHANTFVNLGEGTASDFYSLAKKYYNLVKEKFGIELEVEVQMINLPPFQ